MLDIVLLNSGGLDSTLMAKRLFDDGRRVHSLHINSGALRNAEAEVAALETANRFCVDHHVIRVNFGYTPNHYEDQTMNIMYDDAQSQIAEGTLDPSTLPMLWTGPPNMGMLYYSLGVSYAKAIDVAEVCFGFSTHRPQSFLNAYNTAYSENSYIRWRPLVIEPYGRTTKNEALAFFEATEADFPWTMVQLPSAWLEY